MSAPPPGACIVCGGFPEDQRYVAHRFMTAADRGEGAGIAAELRSFVNLLADEPADDEGMVRLGAQNLADLLTWLDRAASRLERG